MSESKLNLAIEMMIKTEHKHRMLIDSCVRDIGVQHTQHRILMHLAKRKRLLSQKELAEHLNITPAAVTGALKKIEKDGYIERTLGKDNRYNEISITEKGKELVKLTRETFARTDTFLFAGFSDDELECYIKCLEKMQSNMEEKLEEIHNTKGKITQ